MRAAAQQQQGKIACAPAASLGLRLCGYELARPLPPPMTAPVRAPREYLIKGLTQDGRPFRPSDWAERLAGAMSSFRPGASGRAGIGAYIGYSPYCVPTTVGEVKAVIVNEALRGLEPMAWDFVVNFARDNGLPMSEIQAAPPTPAA